MCSSHNLVDVCMLSFPIQVVSSCESLNKQGKKGTQPPEFKPTWALLVSSSAAAQLLSIRGPHKPSQTKIVCAAIEVRWLHAWAAMHHVCLCVFMVLLFARGP